MDAQEHKSSRQKGIDPVLEPLPEASSGNLKVMANSSRLLKFSHLKKEALYQMVFNLTH